MTASNPDIVAKLYHLDPDTLTADVILRLDGTPATPDEIEAVRAARVVDMRAVLNLHRLALEQSEWELVRKMRIKELCEKYRLPGEPDSTPLGEIEPRMSPQDLAEWNRLWDDLGNIMVLSGEGDQ